MNQSQFFISHDGALVRYSDCATVRPLFARHARNLEAGPELRASLRAGPRTWPGGHAIAYVTADGGMLCPDCVRAEFRQCIYSLRHGCHDGWHIVGTMSAAESDNACACEHCYREIWAGE